MRAMQHKKEAFWFYRFLSIFYDRYVNPFFWTERMRSEALALGHFDHAGLRTVDVGSGTGFTTEGIVAFVAGENVTCLDQSPHQMAHARRKPALQRCFFVLGDAENLPFPTDWFDRYVSAGSIEYWPAPLRGIAEAYRILKPGGQALLIGPVRPKNRFFRWLADVWMLFPEENQYRQWFEAAGFTDIHTRRVAPHWVWKEVYGVAIAGTKPAPGASPEKLDLPVLQSTAEPMPFSRRLRFFGRFLTGNLAGFAFISVAILAHFSKPVRLAWWRLCGKKIHPPAVADPLTAEQKISLAIIAGLLLLIAGLIMFCPGLV